jgi:radical S-adenosyl methionine domain-containing protein 2
MKTKITTVNYHLWKACNMRCKFCYATFQDFTDFKLPKGHLDCEQSKQLISLLFNAGFEKINFAGGEPTLCPWLPELVIYAKSIGFKTSIVTNGTMILKDEHYIKRFDGKLDIVGLSIDSVNDNTNLKSGRAIAGKKVLTCDDYKQVSQRVKDKKIYLKINTVVSSTNSTERITDFINAIRPDRWKILQMLEVKGQNDEYGKEYSIEKSVFENYIKINRFELSPSVKVIEESIEVITGSYIMINPEGCFFDDTKGTHTYSSNILEVGVSNALCEVNSHDEKFFLREGIY